MERSSEKRERKGFKAPRPRPYEFHVPEGSKLVAYSRLQRQRLAVERTCAFLRSVCTRSDRAVRAGATRTGQNQSDYELALALANALDEAFALGGDCQGERSAREEEPTP